MNKSEPPSSRLHPVFIGRDSQGNWVVRDNARQCGGLFVSRCEALKFALSENGHRPRAVVMVPGVLEFDVWDRPMAQPARSTAPVRRAA